MSENQEESPAAHTPGTTKRARPGIKIAAAVVLIGALVAMARFTDAAATLRTVLEWIEGLGALGALIFVGLYIVACVLFLPGSVLTLGAGAIYGLSRATALVSLASVLGATAAFLVGRYLARDWVGKKIQGYPKFKVIDDAVGEEGWKIVGLTRLSPLFPFNFLNYAFGLTRVSLRDYVLASWIGMLPGTVLYVYLGSLAGAVATAGAEKQDAGIAQSIVFAVGLLATLAVTVFVTRLARKALNKRVET